MDGNRTKVMGMLAHGKVSVDEAARLLAMLQDDGSAAEAMDENRTKVLGMLANGRLSVDEAEPLLALLQGEGSAAEAGAAPPAPEAHASVPAADRPVPKNPRFLRVSVNSSDGDKVNIRVPLALVRTGIKMTALIPEAARKQMSSQGIDLSALSELDTDELIDALAALTVDVEASDGDTVRIFCE